MTLSPQLEARFQKILSSYPKGRERSAVIPMLMYAQDEIGSITQELIEEVAHRTGIKPLQVDEVIGYYSMMLFAQRCSRQLVTLQSSSSGRHSTTTCLCQRVSSVSGHS